MASGVGEATGAISVLNAIPTMIGGAVGIELWSRAHVEIKGDKCSVPEGRSMVWGLEYPIEGKILESISRVVAGMLGWRPCFRVTVESEVPIASGLKSSSSLVVSIIRGILDAVGAKATGLEVARAGVEASRMSGITVTGAYDDHLASSCSGVFITDNRSMEILRVYNPFSKHVVILVPEHARRRRVLGPSVFKRYSEAYRIAAGLALSGRWVEAMTLNGILTSIAAGLGYAALRAAAGLEEVLALGVSGKGPAVFAVTEDPERVLRAWRGLKGKIIVTRIRGGSRGRNCVS